MHAFCVEISDAPDPNDGYETRRNSFVKQYGGSYCGTEEDGRKKRSYGKIIVLGSK